jgi:hypothetical protein
LSAIPIAGQIYRCVRRLGLHILIVADEAGNLYEYIQPPENTAPTRWNCICHPDLTYRRPHLTCMAFCRVKRVAQGKLPNLIPIMVYRMLIHFDRPHARIKNFILKSWLTVAEWLAN